MASLTEADHASNHVVLLLLHALIENVVQIVVFRDGDQDFENLAWLWVLVPIEVESHHFRKRRDHPVLEARLASSAGSLRALLDATGRALLDQFSEAGDEFQLRHVEFLVQLFEFARLILGLILLLPLLLLSLVFKEVEQICHVYHLGKEVLVHLHLLGLLAANALLDLDMPDRKSLMNEARLVLLAIAAYLC